MSSEPIIEIDLRARVLNPDEEIYVLFPGEGYSQYEMFRSRRMAFLDFPGLTLVNRNDLSDLKRKLARSDALRDWHQGRWEEGEPAPSRNLSDYDSSRMSERRRTYAASIDKFYFGLPEGTIIVVPGPGGAFGEVLIGELRGGPVQAKIPGYGDDTVPVRSVEWVATVPKRQFSDELIARLQLPIPLVLLDKTLRPEVVRKAYSNYIYGGEYVARISTTSQVFDSLDDYFIQSFVNYIAGTLAALEVTPQRDIRVDLRRALEELRARPELVPELTSNINSPGALRYITQDISSLVIVSFLAIALLAPDAKASNIRVVNSAAPATDSCAYVVDQRVKQAFEIMDIPSLKAACEHAQAAAHKTGLKSSVIVRRRSHHQGH